MGEHVRDFVVPEDTEQGKIAAVKDEFAGNLKRFTFKSSRPCIRKQVGFKLPPSFQVMLLWQANWLAAGSQAKPKLVENLGKVWNMPSIGIIWGTSPRTLS